MVKIHSLTSGPSHHFFGFHDVPISDASGRYCLYLRVKEITKPPICGDTAEVVLHDLEEDTAREIGVTEAFNYPQGARQQWIADTSEFIYNIRQGDGWGAIRCDRNGVELRKYDQAIYMVHPNGKIALGLDFAKMHRLGGYGYVGCESRLSEADPRSGLTKVDLDSGSVSTIVTLRAVVDCGEVSQADSSVHFLTHAVWNPSGTHIVFLHRYWLADGGQMTRVMSVDVDGGSLQVLGQGHFSHFDWLTDREILIWGRQKSAVDSMRNMTGYKAKLVAPLLRIARSLKRRFIKPTIGRGAQQCYLRLSMDDDEKLPVGAGVLLQDGHPMVNRVHPAWFVSDTYPDQQGVRQLYLFNHLNGDYFSLGNFKKLDSLPRLDRVSEAQRDFHPDVVEKFDSDEFAFTRSGLHCDLHPRWFGDFQRVAFDSIHEGTRQIYWVNADQLIV